MTNDPLPWSDPASDPLTDLRRFLKVQDRWLAQQTEQVRAETRFQVWLGRHLLLHGNGFTFTPGYVTCSCGQRCDRWTGQPAPVPGSLRGPRPSMVWVDDAGAMTDLTPFIATSSGGAFDALSGAARRLSRSLLRLALDHPVLDHDALRLPSTD